MYRFQVAPSGGDLVYLNNAGTSFPKPPAVHHGVREALRASPHRAADLYDSAHGAVCAYLDITDRSRFLFTSGGTSALALALGDLPWKTGDCVLTSAVEHHALARPVEKLVRERGIVALRAPYTADSPIDLDFVRDSLRRKPVRLIAVTSASNITGELLPIFELSNLAHEHGALLLVDAAQTIGLTDTRVTALGVDILAFTGHKGALGPQGIGGLWAAPHVAFESPAAVCEVSHGQAPACASFPGFCDVGSVNLAGAVGLAAGLDYLTAARGDSAQVFSEGSAESFDPPASSPRDLARELARNLAELDGVTLLGSASAARTGTVGFLLDALPLDRTEARFASHGISLRAGSHCAPWALETLGVEGAIRASFGPFNTPDHLTQLLDAVRAIGRLPHG